MSAKTIDDGGPVHSLSVHPAHGYGASASVEQGETRRQALARCAMQAIWGNETMILAVKSACPDGGQSEYIAAMAYKQADSMIAFEARERAEMEQKK